MVMFCFIFSMVVASCVSGTSNERNSFTASFEVFVECIYFA